MTTLQVRESGLGTFRSKTVFSRKVEKKDRIRVAENPIKTPQAKARCGVLGGKIQAMQKIACNQVVNTSWVDSLTAYMASYHRHKTACVWLRLHYPTLLAQFF